MIYQYFLLVSNLFLFTLQHVCSFVLVARFAEHSGADCELQRSNSTGVFDGVYYSGNHMGDGKPK